MADRQFIVEAIFRAQDQFSRVLQTIQGNAQKLGPSLAVPVAASGQALDTLATKAARVGQAFSSGNFKSAATDINAVSRSTERLAQSLSTGNFSAAARAALTLGSAFASVAAPTATLAKEFDKVKGLGIASAEGLLAIQGAAGAADISLKVVASGLANFRARVIAAQEGTGKAASALRALGASSDEIKSGFGGTAQALTFVGTRLSQVADESERALLASRLFGQAGTQLIPILTSLGAAESVAATGATTLTASLLPVVAIVASVVAALAGLLITVKTVQAALGAADEGARFADSLQDMSVKAGLTTEQMSQLAFAARQSDTDVSSLANGIKFLSKNLVEAKSGAGEAYDALIQLGLSGDAITAGFGDTEQSLLTLSTRFAAIEDPALRTALALKIFGRSGEQMVPFLIQGADKIRDLIATSDELGATVSNTAGKIGDEYVHALERLHAANEGLKVQLSSALTPAITELVEKLTEVVAGVNRVRQAMSTPLPISDLIPPGAAKDFIDTVDRMRHALELFNRVKELGAAAVNLPRNPAGPPLGPAVGARGVEPASQGPALPSTERVRIQQERDQQIIAAADEATKKAQEDAKKTAEAIAALRKEMTALSEAAFAVPASIIASLQGVGIGLKDQIEILKAAQKALAETAGEAQKLRGLPVGEDKKPLTAAQVAQKNVDLGKLDTTALEKIEPQLTISNAAARHLLATFDDMGIPLDALQTKLAAIGPNLSEIGAICIGVGEAMNQAFSTAFDPLRVGIEGAAQAVFNLRGAFDDAFSSLSHALITGNTGFIKLGSVIEGAVLALRKFVIELGIAIAKAAILRLITGGLFAGGGKVLDVGTGAAFKASGGPIARGFASGGSIATGGAGIRIQRFANGGGVDHFTRPIFAASGYAIPGAPNRMDNVPIWASQGEFVLPNLGSTSGVDIARSLAGGLDAIRDVLRQVGRSERQSYGGSPPAVIHIHANDTDSIRNAVRPGGSFEKQLARAAEMGR